MTLVNGPMPNWNRAQSTCRSAAVAAFRSPTSPYHVRLWPGRRRTNGSAAGSVNRSTIKTILGELCEVISASLTSRREHHRSRDATIPLRPGIRGSALKPHVTRDSTRPTILGWSRCRERQSGSRRAEPRCATDLLAGGNVPPVKLRRLGLRHLTGEGDCPDSTLTPREAVDRTPGRARRLRCHQLLEIDLVL